MNATRLIAVVLIVAGVLGLLYGGFSWTEEKTQAKLGPIELKVSDKRSVDIPAWLSIGAIAAGVVLLVVGGRRK